MHGAAHDYPPDVKWIGGDISPWSVAAVFIVCLVTPILMQVNPLLLNALVQQGRLTVEQIGQIATVELGATGLMTIATVAKLPYRRIPTVIAAAAILAIGCNIATFMVHNIVVLFAARAIHGCCSGIFMWLLIGLLTRSTRSARLNGIYLATQGVVCFGTVTFFTTVVIPRFGVGGGYIGLSLSCLAAALMALALPKQFGSLPADDEGTALRLPFRGWLALVAILAFMASIAGVWVYLPALAGRLGYSHETVSAALSFALVMEIAGGLAAAALAPTSPFIAILKAGYVVLAATIATLALVTSPPLFIGGVGLFGFLWMFLLSPQYPFTLAADPSRRTMTFVGPTQLLGGGIGPVIASLGLYLGDLRMVVLTAGSLTIAAILFTFWSTAKASAKEDASPAGSPQTAMNHAR